MSYDSELVLLARDQARILGEILGELKAQRAYPHATFELGEDGLPLTPGLDAAIGDVFHTLRIERTGGRVAAVTLAVRQYLGTLSGGLS
jgi:hypothetical protein